jgi:cyclopropane fatty-acyl-phospholipid synthase-like methyltransferase
MSATSPTAHAFFVDSWHVYSKIVAHNYMFHSELYRELTQMLQQECPHPISLLDLGCGDARFIGPVLQSLQLTRYCGVDLSEIALALAADNLAPLPCPRRFHCVDMLTHLQQPTDTKYDVIFSSFALHHLNAADKATFFNSCRKQLSVGGMLVLIDVVREEDQDLSAYLEAYCGRMARDWTALEPDELAFAMTHVRNNDQPDSLSTLARMALQSGFSHVEAISQHTWHRLLAVRY